jgi:hypothetical protein
MSLSSEQDKPVAPRIKALKSGKRSVARLGEAAADVRRAASALEQHVGALVTFATGEDENPRQVAVHALDHFSAILNGQPGGQVSEGIVESVKLKQAVLSLQGAIIALTSSASCGDKDATQFAFTALSRFDVILFSHLETRLRDADNAAARLRGYQALGKLGLRSPEFALMLVLLVIGLYPDDDREGITRALAPLTEARRQRRATSTTTEASKGT